MGRNGRRFGLQFAAAMVVLGVLGVTISTQYGSDPGLWASIGIFGGGLADLVRVGRPSSSS